MSGNAKENEDKGIAVSSRLFNFLILGIALIFIGIVILIVVSLFFAGSESVGIVIFIGPFPIVFGKGPDAVWLILIGMTIAVLSIVLFLIMNRRMKAVRRIKIEEIYSVSVSSSLP
jgi:uncharacterized membrane protein